MKLNNKRTILVGFAFLSICAFWQMYDNLVPKILTETFGIGESISGVIMASDNVLALFLLPLFGGLSDKCTSRLGRRRPFILFGTVGAVILMMFLPILTDSFHSVPAAWKTVCFIITLYALSTFIGDLAQNGIHKTGIVRIFILGNGHGFIYDCISRKLIQQDKLIGSLIKQYGNFIGNLTVNIQFPLIPYIAVVADCSIHYLRQQSLILLIETIVAIAHVQRCIFLMQHYVLQYFKSCFSDIGH